MRGWDQTLRSSTYSSRTALGSAAGLAAAGAAAILLSLTLYTLSHVRRLLGKSQSQED